MFNRISIFTKIIVMVLLLLIPILVLYAYSNKVSMGVVEGEIRKSNFNRLFFFLHQVDTTVEQFSKLSITLGKEPEAVQFQTVRLSYELFDSIKIRQTLREKVALQSFANSWTNEITIFSPGTGEFISSNPTSSYDMDYFSTHYSGEWSYRPKETRFGTVNYFIRHSVEPSILFGDIAHANMVIEVSFASSNIQVMLDQFKSGGINEPFFYHPELEPIVTSDADMSLIEPVIGRLHVNQLGPSGSQIVDINGISYVVNYAKSDTLHWYLIDILPLDEVLNPITTARNLFYICFVMFLVMSLLASFLLYRHVQFPIRELLKAVYQLKRGNFSARLHLKTNSEFTILFSHFNSMAAQIQQLIEKVLVESIRVRDATLKQLQSQINPHFLYNCLAFIQSMALLENKQAIIAMTQQLSKYYRYTTRLETEHTELKQELEVVSNYLNIHKMQIRRLDYSVHIPECMLDLQIPRLIVQPIVENAVVHGIEPKVGEGIIRICGESRADAWIITVEDNGGNMTPALIDRLNHDIRNPLNERMGFGVWNVHQRLSQQYGTGSGLVFSLSEHGGLCVTLTLHKEHPTG